jgi:NitT/TauT family transport system substrate-binding protein
MDFSACRHRWRPVFPLLVVCLALAGCGDDDDEADSAATPAAGAASSGTIAPEMESIKVGYPLVDPVVLPGYLAAKLGLYEKYGLEVEYVSFNGDGQTVQALSSGVVDAMSVGGAIAVSAARSPKPVTMIAPFQTQPTDMLVGGKDTDEPADLTGKQVAVDAFGSDPHVSVLLALESLDVDPDDVTVSQVGAEANRVAAVAAGSVAAAPVDQFLEQDMIDEGFHILVKLADAGANTPRHGLMIPQEWIETNPQTALALTAGALEGMQMMFEDTPKAAEIFAEWAQIPVDEATERIEMTLPLIEDQRCFADNDELWKRMQAALEVIDPSAGDVDTTEIWTTQFVDQLKENGIAEKIGAPC